MRGVYKRAILAFSASSVAMILACFVRASAYSAVSSSVVFFSDVVSPAFGRIFGSSVAI